jgi:hypothetical protein
VGRDLASPQLGNVDDIVVQEGRGVDEFHRRRQFHRAVDIAADKTRRRYRQERTKTLAAGLDQMVRQGRDDAYPALHARRDQGVDAGHIGAGQPRQSVRRARRTLNDRLGRVQNRHSFHESGR